MNEATPISLQMVSHELKNSLTLIRSSLQIVESRHLEVVNDPLWMQMCSDVDYMQCLVSDLSMLDSNSDVKKNCINVQQLMVEIEGMFAEKLMVQKKEYRFFCDMREMYLKGNALKIRQMLINLIQNAVEATAAGERIEVCAYKDEEMICFRVSDTGSGMNKEQMETIFCPFVTYKANGTGLGMVIVKNIVDAHDGKISVHSVENEGTQVTVRLPISK